MKGNRKNENAIPDEKETKAEHKKNKSDRKRSVNAVDIVLCLMILSFIVVVVFLFAPNMNFHRDSGENVKLEYTVEISGISKEMAAQINVGDQVFDGVDRYLIGAVINTEIDDCVEYIYNEESGRIEAVAYTDEGNSSVRKTVLVTITANAKYAEGKGYTVNGYRVAVNQEMSLCFPGYTGSGQCISMTVLETEVN